MRAFVAITYGQEVLGIKHLLEVSLTPLGSVDLPTCEWLSICCDNLAHLACSYFEQERVGDYLRSVLSIGATRDWREVLREATGQELSAEAVMAYYAPLSAYLTEQNEGRDCGF